MSLDGIQTKLIDFGIAVQLREGRELMGIDGHPHYRAPEMVCQDFYSSAIDMWALGVVIYESLTGKHPFLKKYHLQTEQSIMEKMIKINDKELHVASPIARNFIMRCLQKDPKKRMKVE